MRQKVAEGTPPLTQAPSAQKIPEQPRVQIPVDASNESTIVATAYLHQESRDYLLSRLVPNQFQAKQHQELWTIFQAAKRELLVLDAALVEALGGPQLREYVEELAALKPAPPKNLAYHVDGFLGDYARVTCVRGPLSAFHEAIRDPKTEASTLYAIAKSISQCFDGVTERKYLHDNDQIIRAMSRDIDERVAGRTCFGYGIETLDFYNDQFGVDGKPRRRMLPGPAPGQTTVVTANPGVGKTTVGSAFSIGIAFPGWEKGDFETPGRHLLYGSFEQRAPMTYEGLAAHTLGLSRSERLEGIGKIATREGRRELMERAETIKSRIRIMSNPFRRDRGGKETNARNLDVLQGYIAASGCRVFVGDLWHRCLIETDPKEETQALYRQQAMAEELDVHCILLQQQRLKEVEMRSDPRPTRENIKGSGTWVEIADTIIGVHRPGIYRSGMKDDVVEIEIMKQRWGVWPLRVAFKWNPDTGRFWDGKSAEFTRGNDVNEVDAASGLAAHLRGGRR